MSYSVQKSSNNTYNIFETETETLICLETTEYKAREICRKLNLGSGFTGWTPSFLARKL